MPPELQIRRPRKRAGVVILKTRRATEAEVLEHYRELRESGAAPLGRYEDDLASTKAGAPAEAACGSGVQ